MNNKAWSLDYVGRLTVFAQDISHIWPCVTKKNPIAKIGSHHALCRLYLHCYASHTVICVTDERIIYCYYWYAWKKVIFNAPAICVLKFSKPKLSQRGKTCCLQECNTLRWFLHGTELCFKQQQKSYKWY